MLYSIIHVICPKNNQISTTAICRTTIGYLTFRVGHYATLSGLTTINLQHILSIAGQSLPAATHFPGCLRPADAAFVIK